MTVSGEAPVPPTVSPKPCCSSRGWGILPRAPWLPACPLSSREYAPLPGAVGEGQTEPTDQRVGLLGGPSWKGVPRPERCIAIPDGWQGAAG